MGRCTTSTTTRRTSHVYQFAHARAQYDLEGRSIRDPLRQYVRFCEVWAELARLNGEPSPGCARCLRFPAI
jgi:hypothetical protein